MTDWAALEDAYGSAEEVPQLLAAAEHGGRARRARRTWEDLWSRLCHQGTVYSASYAALPALATMAARHQPAGYVEPLHLAASIVASDDGPPGLADLRRRYAAELSALRDVAERNLAHADGSNEFVYGLQALMALEQVPVWKDRLEVLADEELAMECPACAELCELDLSDLDPAEPADLVDGDSARAYGLALQHGQAEVAEQMLHLFGKATCPSCGRAFDVPSSLADS
jgi:hypothetical protein